jgi:hydrogenase nickel incorporation protein HypA/HybF
MHELSVAIDLIDAASAEMAKLGPVRLKAVHLRLGPLSGVVKHALQFSFDTAVIGTALDGAQLQIADVPVSVWCETCEAERDLVDMTKRRCPLCHSPAPQVTRGHELQLVGLEIEDA